MLSIKKSRCEAAFLCLNVMVDALRLSTLQNPLPQARAYCHSNIAQGG
ncbi:hypothetical protein BN134_3583 [Cronobacter dublinensis 1210]|uniref:Uncharacterized protein n=1 Tax=Cronobacter dublinensis 1210 TaxID=1208656 RepID=A0ABM9QB65_9ENTR|nr:hypothetical protein BN134_3583 [Cronobacter dublinensis 1210]